MEFKQNTAYVSLFPLSYRGENFASILLMIDEKSATRNQKYTVNKVTMRRTWHMAITIIP